MVIYEATGSLVPDKVTIESMTALYFSQTVVEVYRHLSASGRKVLEGRIRDGLKAKAGLAPLYLEMSIARRLFHAGYQIEFSDMEGFAEFDVRFWKGDVQGEVECKSLTCDAGRKIHREDFYRFIDAIGDLIQTRASSGSLEVLLITLKDRLPTDEQRQRDLREAAKLLMSDSSLTVIEEDFFRITREDFDTVMESGPVSDESEFYEVCRTLYGPNCHVSGVMAPEGVCLVIMRSQKEDDSSKPILEALKKATTQFSGACPAFIAVQFDDILPPDLLLTHLRRRIGIISYYLFHEKSASHVMATCFSAYKSLVASDVGLVEPSFAVLNPKPAFQVLPADYSPFLGFISDADFTSILGKSQPSESISNISIENPEIDVTNVE